MLKYTPAVFAVGRSYQIMVPVTAPSLFWVEVAGQRYDDEQNGIMRSLCSTHRVSVPMEVLDTAGHYTVCERVIIDRKPYFPLTEETVRTQYPFRPVPDGAVRAFHVSDTHNMVQEPVAAARLFGAFDLLIMNGDIPDHSGEISNFDTIYAIAEKLTGGQIPIVFARGNHDMRGYHAEQIAEHTPNQYGNTYYTFRLGNIWGLVLDCGEDKDDTSAEYGHTVSCHAFRQRQTAYIRDVIAHAESEYAAPGVAHRLVVCHNPFTQQLEPPFDIEAGLYTQWAQLLKEHIHPTLMLCGHLHALEVHPVGCSDDHLGQPCTVVIGGDKWADAWAGCGLTFGAKGSAKAVFCKSSGEVWDAEL